MRYIFTCLFVFFSFSVLLTSCETFNPENEIPSYIHIDSIPLQINNSSEGSASHKITEAWVYVNDQQIGVYELPATFPVLLSGKNDLKIFGGIKMNGISATRVAYPFYQAYEKQIDLQIGKIDTIKPELSYFSTISFPLKENFEESAVKIERLPSSDTVLMQISDPEIVFEGSYCGAIFLDNSRPVFRGSSLPSSPLNIPKGEPVFLEMNYRNNQKFSIGIIAQDFSSVYENIIITLHPSETWNKIYINLTEEINKYPNAFGYYLLITALKDNDVDSPAIYLDNIKIVHN